MAEPSSGNEEKEMTKGNSFTRFLRSPAPESPRKKSSNPLAKLLRRKTSSRKGDETSSHGAFDKARTEEEEEEEDEEDEKNPSLVEDVKEVVESAFDDLIHRKKKDTSVHVGDDADNISTRSISSDSSSETKESEHEHHHFLGKFKGGFKKAKEGLKEEFGKAKEEYGKAKDEFKSILNKSQDSQPENSHVHVDHEVIAPNLDLEEKPKHDISVEKKLSIDLEKKPKHDISIEKKPSIVEVIAQNFDHEKKLNHDISIEKKPSIDHEVKAPNLAQRLQEEVVAVISTIDGAKKGKASQEEGKEIVKEEIKKEEEKKKEENCIASLAQGLHCFCSWGSKKED